MRSTIGMLTWLLFGWIPTTLALGRSDIRLRGGAGSAEGRVEIRWNGVWGTVCDDNWGMEEATVACRMLGYHEAEQFYQRAHYGQGSGRIWLDDVSCKGTERSLEDCSHRGWGEENCDHWEDASVKCGKSGDPGRSDIAIRLVGGSSSAEGRVEIKKDGIWGTVCRDGWGVEEARVACRMLGFLDTEQNYHRTKFGPGKGLIWLDDVVCKGTETSLADCRHSDWGHMNCHHSDDVGVRCISEEPIEIRLRGGFYRSEGRVEVRRRGGQWGTVCDDNWGMEETRVACRMLGYRHSETASMDEDFYPRAHLGEGTGPIWMDDLDCTDRESSLTECRHRDWGQSDCSHKEDVGIKCDVPCPDVVYQREWGGRSPDLESRHQMSGPGPYVIIIHTGTRGCNTEQACKSLVREIQNHHMDKKHWADIGYNFLIGEDGNVYAGRGYGKVGAHSGSAVNRKSLGIAVMGDFRARVPNAAALDAIKNLIACGVKYKMIPRDYILKGHRDVISTQSPGDALYRALQSWPHYDAHRLVNTK